MRPVSRRISLLALFALLALTGCGSSGGNAGSSAAGPQNCVLDSSRLDNCTL